jgi:hypothetical protein
MNTILILAAICQAPDFDLNGGVDLIFTLNGGPTEVYKPKAEAPKVPRVRAYTTEKCAPCETLKMDAPRLAAPIIEFYDAPDWTSDKKFPVLHWETPAGWRLQEGWNGPGPFLTNYDESFKKKASAQKVTVVNRRAGLYYGAYPSTYDWPGDLRSHLTQSPHGYDAAYLNGLSDQQVIALHDSDHINRLSESRTRGNVNRGIFGLFRSRNRSN